jgi:hypothetical protein
MADYREPTSQATLIIIIISLFLVAAFIAWFGYEAGLGGM